jgi:SAUR family protein
MCKVVVTIPSLVWLRRTVRRWPSRAAAAEASSGKLEERADAVPAGHVAVRVDGAARRFVVRLAHLNHPAFRELLRQAEEEYGFPAASGPIALPCDEDRFLDVLRRVSASSKAPVSSCLCGPAVRRAGDSRPLLQGMAVESEKLVC